MNKRELSMTLNEKADVIVERATTLAQKANSWIAFSNAVFSGNDSLVADAFPRMTERRTFYETAQYARLNEMMLDLLKKFGVDDGTAAKKSGKFVVRLPKTLHAALEIEANQEGVSLNQLAVSKLGIRLKDSTDITTSLIVEAFKKVYDGWSSDRVIVDPDLNERYLRECRSLGLTQSEFELNHILYDIRKSGKGVLPPATKKERITDYDEFVFAGEIAFRHLQRREGVTLDNVMCDPSLRSRYDAIAKQLSPDQSAFKLRMAAIYLRKTHRLSPISDSHLEWDLTPAGRIGNIELCNVPEFSGMYVFYEQVRPIYAGETARLRHRIERHLSFANQQFLPSWLELGCEKDLELKFVVIPNATIKHRLQLLNSFINAEKPPLNYQIEADIAA